MPKRSGLCRDPELGPQDRAVPGSEGGGRSQLFVGFHPAGVKRAWEFQGRGMQAPHFRAKKDDHQMKEVHMDFMFLAPKEVAGQTLACMVVREAETRETMAAAVPYKTTGTYVSERIVAFLHETGCLHGDIIVR